MTELIATTPGLYPLPDDAKESLADLKGRQKGDLIDGSDSEELAAAYADVRAELIDDQQEAGLDRIVEGQARWDDMLAHPLAVHDAVETRGLLRYYDNNNFYRDEADFLAAVADFLAEEVRGFPGHETLFLLEPSLVESAPGEGTDERASQAIDSVASATDADVVVHPYWGALEERVHAHVLDADIDALGYDFVSATEANLTNINEYGTTDDVALGLVDGQSTRVESPETVRERVEWVEEQTPGADFESIYVTSNTELFHLPVNRYQEKLAAIAAAVQEVPA